MPRFCYVIFVFSLTITSLLAAAEEVRLPPPRWVLGDNMTTYWPVASDTNLPHGDFIEQGGLRCGQVVEYNVDDKRQLSMKRGVVWPCLRIIPNDTNGSLIHHYGSEAEPAVNVDGAPLGPVVVERVLLDGTLTIQGRAGTDLAVTRCTFPSPERRCAIDRWTLRNTGTKSKTVTVAPLALRQDVPGPYGINHSEVTCTAPSSITLAPGQELSFAVLFRAWLDGEQADTVDPVADEASRRAHVAAIQRDLRLETPVPEFDRAFAFCKLRVAEAINTTRGGLMLAPGGLTYYAAVWCNDNVEYAGPFFPFLGDAHGNQASLDTYRLYRPLMKPDYQKIPSSIIAEGVDTWAGAGDRGDAAMYAYGCSRFCLARGDKAIAEELWPAIAWCLEYGRRQTTPEGVIASDTDELEGRLPTGKANLSTAALHYGGLRSAADLGRALGHVDEAKEYDRQADALAKAIESYFGATVDGFATYRYYDTNTVLRSWICLPLSMGLMDRRDGTIAALFSPRLWTQDGLASQAGDQVFWDRSTLYGFRGVFQAGETATGLCYLEAYTRRRLLGEHVPYPVECGPEGGQQHLSSESSLYCRIFTEGLFGVLPTGLDRFRCTPRLPDGWPRMALRSIRAFGRTWDLVVERQGEQVCIIVEQDGKRVYDRTVAPGTTVEIGLGPSVATAAASDATAKNIALDPDGGGQVFEGVGAVSAGASSRLLIEYPEKQRSEVLDFLFKPNFGAGFQHLKVEIGGEVNSSCGTELTHMRSRDDENYERGYEWWLMKEAKRRNGEVILDCLAWGAPGWIGGGNYYSQDMADYVVKFLQGARKVHGLDIAFTGIWNETPHETSWIKLLRRSLDAAGFQKTGIVGTDDGGDPGWKIVEEIGADPELRAAVARVGYHYPVFKSPAAARNSGCPLWSSEDGPWRGDWTGAAQIARVLNRNYVTGRFVKTEIWSPVTSYYDSLPLPGSGVMRANEPWTGYYEVQPAVWAVAHTTQFARPGWRYVDSACVEIDGGSVVALQSPDGKDFSLVIETMDAKSPQTLEFQATNLPNKTLHVWRSSQETQFDRIADIRPKAGKFSLAVEPNCIYSLTTTSGQRKGRTSPPPSSPLPLPFTEDFSKYKPGDSPRLFSDQAGLFEVQKRADGLGNCLSQVRRSDGIQWSGHPDPRPETFVGDINWKDYSVIVDARFPADGYAMLLGRVTAIPMTDKLPHSYVFRISGIGDWELRAIRTRISGKPYEFETTGDTGDPLAHGHTELTADTWHRLELRMVGDEIAMLCDGKNLGTVRDSTHTRGQVGLGCDWSGSEFANFSVQPR